MKLTAHLHLEEMLVAPSEEWAAMLGGWYVIRLTQGQAYWLAEATALSLEAGQVLVLPPARCGVLRASQIGPVRLHYFRFCPELLLGLLTLAERQCLDHAALKPRLAPLCLEGDHTASQLFAAAVQSLPSKEGLPERAQLLQIVAHCFSWDVDARSPEESLVLPASKRLQVLVKQLTESELCQASASALAAQCGCSVPHLNRLFQSLFGTSLRARQAELRLLRARQLLLQTDDSVQDIARAVGARHLSYFNTQFKREFGISPADFRRQQGYPGTASSISGKLVA